MVVVAIVFFCVIVLIVLFNVFLKVKFKNSQQKVQNDKVRVFFSSIELHPWRTGKYKIQDGILFTEWARFDGGDSFDKIRLLKCWKQSSVQEEVEYKKRHDVVK